LLLTCWPHSRRLIRVLILCFEPHHSRHCCEPASHRSSSCCKNIHDAYLKLLESIERLQSDLYAFCPITIRSTCTLVSCCGCPIILPSSLSRRPPSRYVAGEGGNTTVGHNYN
ncbi:unnamed protein product, partial [Amoebophrya sp. A25]